VARRQLEPVADFSSTLDGMEVLDTTIDAAGNALVLAVDSDVAARLPDSPQGQVDEPYTAALFKHHASGGVHAREMRGLTVAFPLVEQLPDGQTLIVGTRCAYRDEGPELNAAVFDRDGNRRRDFCLGDGIQWLQTTSAGKVWVGYFDEGVFGNLGWAETTRGEYVPPVGARGLVRFDSAGNREWSYEPPAGRDSIADCYALNVTDDLVWTYYYTDFPLAQVDEADTVRCWSTNVGGATAIAVDDGQVVLAGGYGEERRRLVSLTFDGDRLRETGQDSVCIPTELGTEWSFIGRGSELHVLGRTRWLRVPLS
jgi:hypothetical protein